MAKAQFSDSVSPAGEVVRVTDDTLAMVAGGELHVRTFGEPINPKWVSRRVAQFKEDVAAATKAKPAKKKASPKKKAA